MNEDLCSLITKALLSGWILEYKESLQSFVAKQDGGRKGKFEHARSLEELIHKIHARAEEAK